LSEFYWQKNNGKKLDFLRRKKSRGSVSVEGTRSFTTRLERKKKQSSKVRKRMRGLWRVENSHKSRKFESIQKVKNETLNKKICKDSRDSRRKLGENNSARQTNGQSGKGRTRHLKQGTEKQAAGSSRRKVEKGEKGGNLTLERQKIIKRGKKNSINRGKPPQAGWVPLELIKADEKRFGERLCGKRGIRRRENDHPRMNRNGISYKSRPSLKLPSYVLGGGKGNLWGVTI